ncbi:MAG: HEAT repeat domain-containing protein [Bryobacterales bacterium]|nr:HEAT repeat domain-containing protein [Bryobacterales bacterium]
MRTIGLLLFSALALAAFDDDRKTIIRAIKDYAKQGSSSIPKIEPYLQDKDDEVRWEAVKAIAEVGGPRSLDPLLAATRDSAGEIQIRATDGLVNFYLPGYLKTGLLSGSLRRTTTAFRGRFSDVNNDIIDLGVTVKPEVIEALGKLVRDPNAAMEARACAARALGILRGKAALDDIYEGLRSKNDLVLQEGLLAVQKIRDLSSGPKIQFLLRDLNDRVQINAIETTGILRNRDALPTLKDILETDKNIKVRRAALTAIAMMADESSRPVFEKYFPDPDEGLRGAAAEGYARMKNPQDLPALEKAFNEEKKANPRLSQAFACVALGKRDIAEFSPLQYLVNTLNSKLYRDVAGPLLAELSRDTEIRRSLYPALNRPDATREEKIRLAQIFAATGDRETLDVLNKLKDDGDVQVGQEAARAARNLAARLP